MNQAQDIVQVVASGLMMGLIYALIAVGLSLIFGLMDVVNFAHGEFLMLAMYATFGLVVLLSLDPLILSPIVAAIMFVVGAFCYRAIIVHAMRARTNVGMVQVFATFGLAIVIRGLVGWIDDATGASSHGLVSQWPFAAQVALFVVTHDLYIYWFHRWQHSNRWLWRLCIESSGMGRSALVQISNGSRGFGS